MSINKVILVGRLGKDVEVRYSPSNQAVANLTLATSESFKNKEGKKEERTEWHRVIIFGRMAELADKYLHKGRQVYIEGKLQTRSWDKDGQKHYTTEIIANNVQFLDGVPPVDKAVHHLENNTNPVSPKTEPPQQEFTVDDIPF